MDDDQPATTFTQIKEMKKEKPFKGLGKTYTKKYYEEVTYGEIREKEGRLQELLQNEKEWEGRSQGRHWRGRSSSRCRERTSEYGNVWRAGQVDQQQAPAVDVWEGRHAGWEGRVSSVEREVVTDTWRAWRGRSPGVSDISVTVETWV